MVLNLKTDFLSRVYFYFSRDQILTDKVSLKLPTSWSPFWDAIRCIFVHKGANYKKAEVKMLLV